MRPPSLSRTTDSSQQHLREAIGATSFNVLSKLIGSATMEVILGPFLMVVLRVVELYQMVVIIHVVLHWLVDFKVVNKSNKFINMIGDFCHRATEPILEQIRRRLPNLGGLDISPLVLIVALWFVELVIKRLSHGLG